MVAALHPFPRPVSSDSPSKDEGETQASKFAVDMLPGFVREEKLRQAHLHDRAVFEQVEASISVWTFSILGVQKVTQSLTRDFSAVSLHVQSVTQMYEEASKMLEQPRAISPKLKGAFKSERHEVEREMWQHELEV